MIDPSTLHLPSLANALRRGARVSTIIDVGAASAGWSAATRTLLPASRSLLIEARESHRPALESFARRHPASVIVMAAAGDREGATQFIATPDPEGGAACPGAKGPHVVDVPMTTIDAEVTRHALPAPYLLKLDTHGFEKEILAGATATLRETSIVVLELYGLQFSKFSQRFPAMCLHMETLGFRCADMWAPVRRPSDGVLWQFDALFERADSPAMTKVTM